MKLLICILKDLLEPLSFLPAAAVLGAAAVFVRRRLVWKAKGRSRSRRSHLNDWYLGLLVTYLAVMIVTVFLSREPGSRRGVDLGFLDTWSSSPVSQAYVIENILLMIPLGILLPRVFKPFRSVAWCTAAGLLVSLCIECVQLITGRGYFQLDDIWTNTLGAFLGAMVTSRIWGRS